MKVLPQFGVEVNLLPTTLLGRHPGWGVPGGGAVPDELFSGMIDGLNANNLVSSADVIVTGYFASAEQVLQTVRLLDNLPERQAPVIVDAILGDCGKGLYVKEDVAEAMTEALLPRADILKCNSWEYGEIVRRAGGHMDPARQDIPIKEMRPWITQGTDLGMTIYISSVRRKGKIGALCADRDGAYWSGHACAADGKSVPNGLGDLMTCLIAANSTEEPLSASCLVSSVLGDFLPIYEAQTFDQPSELNLASLGLVVDVKRQASVQTIW